MHWTQGCEVSAQEPSDVLYALSIDVVFQVTAMLLN